ncbi:chemotaxis protein CheA [Altererythrobacter sp.]|uniref:chemotaxis protein CheA n=1 Tax=Altererythrobacter sp. TaxID=1872480 RepID=UPI003CFC04C5
MEELLAEFVAETREMLKASEGEIIAWEADPTDRARLDTIFRFVHTVKGNCGFFDFPRLEKLSHAAEDALAEVRAGRRRPDANMVTAVLSIIDRISEMVDAIENGEELGDDKRDQRLIDALEEGYIPEDEPVTAGPEYSDQKSGQKPENSIAAPRSIRLSVDLLDRVMSGVSDMVLARNDLAHRLREAGTQPAIDGPFERLSTILTDVREAVTRMRMQRLEFLFGAFPRMVRDLSAELGKQVMIDIEGGDVELDREMIEMIRDPMTHIIRNAIDHGIETPADRRESGKHEIGILRIAARQSSNKISIVVNDDGAGLQEDRIADKAVANGLISTSARKNMTRDEILQLVFEPGLSTSETVSAVSGRGVGLDVVRDNIEKIGGSIRVSSTPGEGTQFLLQIPLTLSIISALAVEVADQQFAIPQSYVEEIVHLGAEHIQLTKVGGTTLIDFRGQRTPCLSLGDTLGIEHSAPTIDRSAVLMKLANGNIFAMIVDRIHSISDLVVKPLPPAIMATNCYAGSTLLDNGRPILVLDIALISRTAGFLTESRSMIERTIDSVSDEQDKDEVRAMLFTDFDGHRRAIALGLVQRIETIAADAIERTAVAARAVVDDEILPLAGLPDGPLPDDHVRLLRLSDGSSEVLYAVERVEDSVVLDQELVKTDDDPVLEAVTLVDGVSVGVIDAHTLFAKHGAVPKRVSRLSCSLPDDEWSRRMLAPLLANAGYEIVRDDEEEADVAITLDGQGTSKPRDGKSAVIDLRSTPDSEVSGEEKESSIYRYNRAALLEALRQVRKGEAA